MTGVQTCALPISRRTDLCAIICFAPSKLQKITGCSQLTAHSSASSRARELRNLTIDTVKPILQITTYDALGCHSRRFPLRIGKFRICLSLPCISQPIEPKSQNPLTFATWFDRNSTLLGRTCVISHRFLYEQFR